MEIGESARKSERGTKRGKANGGEWGKREEEERRTRKGKEEELGGKKKHVGLIVG